MIVVLLNRLHVLGMLLIVSWTSSIWAHTDKVWNLLAFPFPDEQIPVIDGDLAEWRALGALSGYYRGLGAGRSADLPSLQRLGSLGIGTDPDWDRGEVSFGWNRAANEIYIAMTYVGKKPVFDSSDPWSIARNDLLGFFVDIDHTGQTVIEAAFEQEIRSAIEEDRLPQYNLSLAQSDTLGTAQAWFINPWLDNGNLLLWNIAAHWPARPPHAVVARADMERIDGFTLEAKLTLWDQMDARGPEFSCRHQLHEKDILGLNLVFCWLDPKRLRSFVDIWSYYQEPFGEARSFAHLILEPAFLSTVLHHTSWGRLKRASGLRP